MITLFYKGAWIHENLRDNTVMVQLPIKHEHKLYYTKEVKSVHAAKLFITKNKEYLRRLL
jgi:hypothetical protein